MTAFRKLSWLLFRRRPGLIDHDLRIPVGVRPEPGRPILAHIHTAVAAVAREGLVAAAIVMGELRAPAVIRAPPGVVNEEAAPVVKNRVMDRRRRIPERRTRRVVGLEFVRRFAILRG